MGAFRLYVAKLDEIEGDGGGDRVDFGASFFGVTSPFFVTTMVGAS